MKRDLEYFKEFLADPGSYRVREFYQWIREWIGYVKEHSDEFNYLEDEEWREVRERVLEALEIKEDMRDEFEELQERLDSVDETWSDNDRLEIYREWLEFMKRNQDEYYFTDDQIEDSENCLNKLVLSVLDCEIAEERLKGSRARHQKSLAEMDDWLAGHYERTGHRIVLTSLSYKYRKRLKGN